jgi:AraC-like DNA-binding protein/quercetin dioxygenase-like cupin family protein
VVTSEFIPESAGERFGSVIRTGRTGEFLLRLSRYRAGLRLPVHHHPRAYFTFVARGGMDEWSGGRERRFETGSVHFHPPRDPHEGRTGPEGMTCLSIIPLGTMADRILSRSESGPDPSGSGAMRWSAARCYRAFCGDDEPSWLCAEAGALELAAAWLRLAGDGTPARAPRWLDAVRSHIDRNFARPIRLCDLGALAGVHAVYLARAFRRHVGVTPGDYVRRLRIEAARTELSASSKPIAEVAIATGFSSQAHLTRVFHHEVGLPPGAFRRRYRRRTG